MANLPERSNDLRRNHGENHDEISHYKTCPDCGLMKPEMSFIMNEVCYSCVYKRKVELRSQGKKKVSIAKCKMCSKRVPKGRVCYCSIECADDGARKTKADYIKKNFSMNVESRDWHTFLPILRGTKKIKRDV